MTIAPPIQSFEEFEAATLKFLEPPFRSKFGAVPWDQIGKTGRRREYLIVDILTRREVSILYGESGSGKSFQALAMAAAIALGEPFQGKRTLQGGVVFQAGEGGLGVDSRVQALKRFHGLENRHGVPFTLLAGRVDLFAKDDPRAPSSNGTESFISEVKHWAAQYDCPLELVVIDTLATATPGANENASTDMSIIIQNLERVQRECQCHVMLVHHKPRQGNNPRGHSSLFAAVDNAIELSISDRIDVETRDDGSELVRSIHRATIQKNKDGERGHGWDFILRQVAMGENEYGEKETSVICTPPVGQKEDVGKKVSLTDQQHMAFQALVRALEQNGESAPESMNLPKSIRTVVRMKYWRAAYAALSMIDDEDEKKKAERIKKALQRSGEMFLTRRWIGRAEPYVWTTGKPVPGFADATASPYRRTYTPDPLPPMTDAERELSQAGDILL